MPGGGGEYRRGAGVECVKSEVRPKNGPVIGWCPKCRVRVRERFSRKIEGGVVIHTAATYDGWGICGAYVKPVVA